MQRHLEDYSNFIEGFLYSKNKPLIIVGIILGMPLFLALGPIALLIALWEGSDNAKQ